MIFFISDPHFGHKNIIKLQNESFSSIEERDSLIIERWNEVVHQTDIVYILGDLSFYDVPTTRELLSKLNGTIYVIRGNHDKAKFLNELKDCGAIEDWYDYKELNIDKQKYCLFHYPLQEWNGYFHNTIHIHGHTHSNNFYSGKAENKGIFNANSFNVGVEATNFYPISLNFIKEHKMPLLKGIIY